MSRPLRSFASSAAASPADAPEARARALPHLVMPAARDRRLGSVLVSAALHGLILFFVLTPLVLSRTVVVPREQGAGGPGPAGGGGGGTSGTGGDRERLRYIAMAPPPPPPAATTATTPQPVVPAPTVTAPAPTVVAPPAPAVAAATPSDRTTTPAPVTGVGGGTGTDGTAGSGPGSGGGVGTGVGTGRGSATGAGTGGGVQKDHPPTLTEMFIPPLPVPGNVKGFHLVAEFDVDETGRVLDVRFTETRSGGYNRQLRGLFRSFKWRPGTRPDGTPVRMKVTLEYDF